jgi:uncharacterized protein with HEPN domain
MQPKTKGLLWDIGDSARFILEETTEETFETYVSDRRLRQAVERNFEIIGEAARRLANFDPDIANRLTDLPKVIAFRNVLAHGYDEVKDERVWTIIQDFLPILREEVEDLLRGAGSE